MFTGWRVRPRLAAALLIRSRKDLLERFRDHAQCGMHSNCVALIETVTVPSGV